MIRSRHCLNERELLSVYNREGRVTWEAHFTTCEGCRKKYLQLRRDLDAIGNALRSRPLADFARQNVLPVRAGWPRLAAAIALVLVLVLGGLGMWKSSSRFTAQRAINPDTQSILDEFPANPFLLGEAVAKELGIDESADLDAAMEWETGRSMEWFDFSPGELAAKY